MEGSVFSIYKNAHLLNQVISNFTQNQGTARHNLFQSYLIDALFRIIRSSP